jgi:O-antigen/teichoic acid export membrane protein
MHQNKSLKINFIMNVILTAASFLFPLITFPYVSRILLPAGTGKVALATSVITYFSMAAMLGIPTYGIRICAQVRDNKERLSATVHEIFFINFIMTLLVYGILLICLLFIPAFQKERILYLVLSSTILFNLIGMEWLYKALEEYKYITIRSIIFKFLSVFLILLLVQKQTDYRIYGAITIFASTGSSIMNFINVRKFISFKYCGPYNYSQHLKPIFTFFSLSVAATVYTNMDIILLGFIQGDAAVGYYNSALKIKNILIAFITSLSTVLLPRSSYYAEKKLIKEFIALNQKAIRFVITASIPLSIFFMLLAKESILFLSGEAFIPAIQPTQILMPTIVLIGLTNIIGVQYLVPLSKEKFVLYSTVTGAIVDIIINLILIPRIGVSGTAIATLTAEFSVLLVQLFFIRKSAKSLFHNLQLSKITLSLLPSVLSLVYIRGNCPEITLINLICISFMFWGIYVILLKLVFHYNFTS